MSTATTAIASEGDHAAAVAAVFILPLQAEDATVLAVFWVWFHASAWLLLACGLGLALRGLRRLFAPGTALTGE